MAQRSSTQVVSRMSYIQKLLGAPPISKAVAGPRNELPVNLPDELKFEHTWMMSASGAGKTTILFSEIVANLKRPNPPAMVIIDPKGTMLNVLSRLKLFEDNDRLVIIDPSDLDHPPALNIFAPPNKARFSTYPPNHRMQIENQIISLFSYILNSKGQAFTPKQATCFQFIARLMFEIKDATLKTLLDVLKDKPSRDTWLPYVARLSDIERQWFEDEFYNSKGPYRTTRYEIAERIYGVLGNHASRLCFVTPQRKIDMFEMLQQRKTVIVNVPVALLEEGAELLGRYMIGLTLAAALERLTIPDKKKWVPAFLYLDEGYLFADEDKMPKLFQLAREYKLGTYFINQDGSQLPGKLYSAIAGSTRIKYASALNSSDKVLMSKEFDGKASMFDDIQPSKDKKEGTFLVYVRSPGEKPRKITFPFGEVKEPMMSEEAHTRLIERNRKLVSVDPVRETPMRDAPKEDASPTKRKRKIDDP